LLPEVGGGFRRCRGGGSPPSLLSEDETGHYFSGGGPSSESEGHPLAQRQQWAKGPFQCADILFPGDF
jgi:hypothetical protein